MKNKIMGICSTYPTNQVIADLLMNPVPPTLYSIMNSIANYGKEEKTKIRNLAAATHEDIFDFEYDLSEALDKDQFEIDILNHFMMRRIGFETFTAFQLYLENKLHEILPYYNLMFDSFNNYSLFNNGETETRSTNDTRNIINNNTSAGESRFSEFPLNELSDIDDGNYVTTQTKNNITNSQSSTNVNNISETINRSPMDKMTIYKSYLETKRSVMSMIYKDLDILFYGIAD